MPSEFTTVTSSATSVDIAWILMCAALVMLMQAGFCCLESGFCRAKNSINVAIKNLIDFCIAAIAFWAFGFAFMFGSSWEGLVGTSWFAVDPSAGNWLLTFLLFQLVFCGTATTIVSGAVAERTRFSAYLMMSLLISGVLYPILGHWVWGGALEGTASGWLARLGFTRRLPDRRPTRCSARSTTFWTFQRSKQAGWSLIAFNLTCGCWLKTLLKCLCCGLRPKASNSRATCSPMSPPMCSAIRNESGKCSPIWSTTL